MKKDSTKKKDSKEITTPPNNDVTVQLKAFEAYTRDVGRGVARIDYDSMDTLGASTGDVVEIVGKRRTVAKCLPLYPSDEGKAIVRIDGLIRNNGGLGVGDLIQLKKTKAVIAQKVDVAPLEAIPPIDERYLADALDGVPLITKDHIMVPYFGGRLSFVVLDVQPSDTAVMVTTKTVFTIGEKLKNPEDIELVDLIKKIDKQIKEQETELKKLVSSTKIDETQVSAIFKKISNLEDIKKYFGKKIKS